MEITKQNQTFNLKDTTSDGWTVSGSATQEVDGNTSINFSVSKDGELNNQVGYYNYNVPTDGMVNINITAIPENLDAVIDYTQTATKKLKIISLTKQFLSNMGRKKPNSAPSGLSEGGKTGKGKGKKCK